MAQIAEKKRVIDLPVKLMFTEKGINFFLQNQKKLNRFKTAENKDVYGLAMESFSLASLQRMIHVGYVSAIEVAQTEFLAYRKEITDLTKLIVYSGLYKKFDHDVFKALVKSDLIVRWNRMNPGSIIDEKTRINETYLQGILGEKKEEIRQVMSDIRGPIIREINDDPEMAPEEKNIHLLLSEKYLERMRPLIWFLLTRYMGSREYTEILREIRKLLRSYIQRASIPEYMSLMILELTSYIENNMLKREAKRIYRGTVDPELVTYDSALREQILGDLESRGEKLFLSYKVCEERTTPRPRHRLEVTIYNKQSGYTEMRQQINDKKGINLREKSLMEFYQGAENADPGAELGLYYLSYLSDACDKVKVRFESNVHQISNSDLTVIDLILGY